MKTNVCNDVNQYKYKKLFLKKRVFMVRIFVIASHNDIVIPAN